MIRRCDWCETNDLMRRYHDTEWGVPVHDDRRHFEFLVLDTFQAGLSWNIILQKREGFRSAFAGFDPQAIARFESKDVERLLGDTSIVRNRRKIEATLRNARAFLDLQARFGSFDALVWRFVEGAPIVHRFETPSELPAESVQSQAMSKELKRLGFGFVGYTTCYAYMQAAGMINDHLVGCFRHKELAGPAPVTGRPRARSGCRAS